jgi:hypothetical protein
MAKVPSRIYRVTFYSQNTIYELYAKHINSNELFGFVVLSELVFGATAGLVVDPSEERLKNEFSGVNATYIPMHSVLRIDEVEKEGIAKIRELSGKEGSNIAHFPAPIYPPKRPSGE